MFVGNITKIKRTQHFNLKWLNLQPNKIKFSVKAEFELVSWPYSAAGLKDRVSYTRALHQVLTHCNLNQPGGRWVWTIEV